MTGKILILEIIFVLIFNMYNEINLKEGETQLYWCKITSSYFYGNIDNCKNKELLLKNKKWD